MVFVFKLVVGLFSKSKWGDDIIFWVKLICCFFFFEKVVGEIVYNFFGNCIFFNKIVVLFLVFECLYFKLNRGLVIIFRVVWWGR